MSEMTQTGLQFTLYNDDKKTLKSGKRRYGDGNGHMLYLSADEVERLDSAESVTLTVQPAK